MREPLDSAAAGSGCCWRSFSAFGGGGAGSKPSERIDSNRGLPRLLEELGAEPRAATTGDASDTSDIPPQEVADKKLEYGLGTSVEASLKTSSPAYFRPASSGLAVARNPSWRMPPQPGAVLSPGSSGHGSCTSGPERAAFSRPLEIAPGPVRGTARPREPQRVRRRRRSGTFLVGGGKSTRTPPLNVIGLHSSSMFSCITGLFR
mmetsp:Transcript_74135/g.193399  ORF Transcript_74135/g.193399 Transcript_74135/m.193399 type:complete len:205 (+) Transcript_74135:236-850(+)